MFALHYFQHCLVQEARNTQTQKQEKSLLDRDCQRERWKRDMPYSKFSLDIGC